MVLVDNQAYARTRHRRSTGWFGHAVADHRARVRAPGLEKEVAIEDVGDGAEGLRRAVDQAFTATYPDRHSQPSIDRMTDDSTAAATLRQRVR